MPPFQTIILMSFVTDEKTCLHHGMAPLPCRGQPVISHALPECHVTSTLSHLNISNRGGLPTAEIYQGSVWDFLPLPATAHMSILCVTVGGLGVGLGVGRLGLISLSSLSCTFCTHSLTTPNTPTAFLHTGTLLFQQHILISSEKGRKRALHAPATCMCCTATSPLSLSISIQTFLLSLTHTFSPPPHPTPHTQCHAYTHHCIQCQNTMPMMPPPKRKTQEEEEQARISRSICRLRWWW